MPRSITPRELDNALSGEERMLLLDVRSRNEHELHPEAIPGALWRDPAALDTWLPSIPDGACTVVYCAGGGEASRLIQSRLAARGVAARYLEGGLAAWRRQHGGEHGEQGGPATRAGEGCAHPPIKGEPGGHVPAGGESGLHRGGSCCGTASAGRGGEAGGPAHHRGDRLAQTPGSRPSTETGGNGGRGGKGEGGGPHPG